MEYQVQPLSVTDLLALGEMREAEALALDIVSHSRNTLLLALRYMGMAIGRLELTPLPGLSMGTDGQQLVFDVRHVFHLYRTEPEALTRDLLHGVLHCVFSHPFVDPALDRDAWDLACDMAVEHAINSLGLPHVSAGRQSRQAGLIEALPPTVNPPTAEKIYHWLKTNPVDTEPLRAAFYADDHDLWYIDPTASRPEGDRGDRQDNPEKNKLATEWKEISQRIQVDAETASHRQDGGAGTLVQSLREFNRERHDYSAFLRRFAALTEEIQISPDEFDYIFYTHGLRLYQNMPLIEPLEYREVNRIRQLVVAIDTSGSVSGEQVQQFVQKTYDILKQSESFASRVQLRILQCDAEIREDVTLSTQDELDEYFKTMQLRGFGGTDFRPVFRHVDRLLDQGELTGLKGLIYFTDGQGIFPAHMPSYETAFVFVEDWDQSLDTWVPVWAIRLVLRPGEL